MERARTFVFAAEEDFGIVPVEAQACGVPVIAFGKGGVLEIVIDGENGILFYEQTVTAVMDAVTRFEKTENLFDPVKITTYASQFDVAVFKKKFFRFIKRPPLNQSQRH